MSETMRIQRALARAGVASRRKAEELVAAGRVRVNGEVAVTGQPVFHRYRCPGCGHIYDEQRGNAREGFPAGTRWDAIPADWTS